MSKRAEVLKDSSGFVLSVKGADKKALKKLVATMGNMGRKIELKRHGGSHEIRAVPADCPEAVAAILLEFEEMTEMPDVVGIVAEVRLAKFRLLGAEPPRLSAAKQNLIKEAMAVGCTDD